MSALNDRESSSPPTGLQRYTRQVPKALAGLAAVTILAFLEGWIYATAYLSQFGAAWILDQIPPALVLERSLIPLLLLMFFVLLTVMGLFDSERYDRLSSNTRFTASVAMMVSGPWLLIALTLLDISLGTLGYQSSAAMVSSGSVVALLLLAAAGLDCLIARLRRPDIRLNRPIVYLASAVLLAELYLVPLQLGRNFGQLDRDPASSTLSTIRLRHVPDEYRLLLSAGDRLYIFPAGYRGELPPIETASASDVEWIQRPARSPE